MADINGDNIKDLIFGDRAGDIQYYSRNSSGSLKYEGKIQANNSNLNLGLQAASPCLVDWNEDGLLDIIVGAGIWKTKIPLRLYINKGTKQQYRFEEYENIFYGNDTISATYPQIEVVDLDGDGVKDILLQDCFYDSWLGGDTTNLFFFKNVGSNSNPQFNSRDTVKYNGQPIKSKLAKLDTKDLNGDGTVDIAVSGTGRNITIYYNDHPVSIINPIIKSNNSIHITKNVNIINIEGKDLVSWQIFDISGKTLENGNFKNSSNKHKIKILDNKNLKILSIKTTNGILKNYKLF